MKRFLIKLILFALPLLLFCTGLEVVLRRIPNDYAWKNSYLEQHAEEIETLVLGSSHGVFNVNPEFIPGHAFNAGHLSQSLKYDAFIFEKFLPRFDRLKYVLIPVHYRSLVYELDDDPEYWRQNYYAIYYGCRWPASPLRRLEVCTATPLVLLKRAAEWVTSRGTTTLVSVSPLGFGILNEAQGSDPLEHSGIWTADRHTLTDRRYLESNCALLDRLMTICADRHIEVILFSPPVYKSYAQHMDADQLGEMQNRISGLVRAHANARYFDFFRDDRFSDEDFYDADHLNASGAETFTKILCKAAGMSDKE